MKGKRKKIWDKTGGKCYYCGCDLKKGWHQDHLVPIHRNRPDKSLERYSIERGDDTVDNLVPSCPRCNLRKDVFDIETFRNEIAAQVERLMNHSNQFRLALDYGLIEITGEDVEFYFEKDNSHCDCHPKGQGGVILSVTEVEEGRCKWCKRKLWD